MRLRLAIPLLFALAAVTLPGIASGATVDVSSGNRLLFLAAGGETNDLTVSQDGATWKFRDPGASISPGTGCSSIGPNEAHCVVTQPVVSVRIDLGDLNDRAVGDESIREPDSNGEPFNVNGGPGNDRIIGAPRVSNHLRGADRYFDNPGDDELTGGDSRDELFGGSGDDLLDGLGDRDDLFGGADSDVLRGGDGNDFFASDQAGPDGGDTLIGGRDYDRVSYEGADDVVIRVNGEPDDGIGCPGPACEGDDVGPDIESVQTGEGNDTIIMGAISNEIFSGGGDDFVNGGAGRDWIYGGEGEDNVSGGAGDDHFYASPGSDVISGDGGDDVFEFDYYSSEGSDSFAGGSGDDLATYQGSLEEVRVSLDGRPNDGPRGKNDNIARDVEDVIGTEGPDVLIGNRAANELTGLGGADRLVGGKGADGLIGGSGRDQLIPGAGADALAGGSGNDLLKARGGGRDDLVCGAGMDRFTANRGDRVGRDCDRNLKRPRKKRRR